MRPLNPGGTRILLTADAIGGVWRYAVDLGTALRGRGAAVAIAVIGPAPSAGQASEARDAGLDLHHLEAPLDWMVGADAAERIGAAELAALIEGWRPTVLHLNTPPLAAQLRRRMPDCGIPVVVASHSCLSTWWGAMRETPLPDSWRWHAEATAGGFAAADAVVAPSDSHARAMQRVYGPLPGLRVVHNGSDSLPGAGQLPDGRGRVMAIAAGRWWDEAKDAETLDAAAARSSCPVQAAGPLQGPNGGACSFRAVEWLGDLPHAALLDRLAGTAICVSPARYEPFGLTVLEAAVRGAALLLSDIPTFRELWDGCACFVPAADAEGFARALDRLHGDAALRRRLGRAARQRAATYSTARQAAGFLRIYRAAMAAHSQAA